MIDFWKDYDGTNSEKIPSMRGIDYERIKAYCEAIGVDMYKQSINAKFMNEMEEWYLNLAERMKLHQVDYCGDSEDIDGSVIYDTAFCPSCGHEYEEGEEIWNEPFCPHCGTRLDWSMINEQT